MNLTQSSSLCCREAYLMDFAISNEKRLDHFVLLVNI